MLRLKNTLSNTIEDFNIKPGETVGMYNCGPTVYNYAHIGNLRAYVFADTLRRALLWNGYKVNQVINITDIGHLSSDNDDGEDKMTKALIREGKPLTLEAMREVANFYFEAFKKDLSQLNILEPEHFPFASDHISEDIELVDNLTNKGFTYPTSDGIYFDTSKYKEYGKLGGGVSQSDEHSRIGINTEKKNPRDFALWKFNNTLGYDAPFGKGFPGWHIECSAMSMKYLGETFDIHTGGIDHIPVHHNNEIAQSESATGKPFARFWIHSAFVNIEGGKMAKSEDNFITLQTLKDRKLLPASYRYWLLQARYDTPVQFSWESLESSQNALIKLIKQYKFIGNETGLPNEEYKNKIAEALNDNLDTPKIISLLWEMLKDESLSSQDKKATFALFEEILGFPIDHLSTITTFTDQKIENLPNDIQSLIQEREDARKEKDWVRSDEIRDQLLSKGYTIKDSEDGPQINLK